MNWRGFAAEYLSAYQKHRTLELSNLDYYVVRRCLLALLQGVEGQVVWQNPLVVRDVLAQIREKAGLRISPPGMCEK